MSTTKKTNLSLTFLAFACVFAASVQAETYSYDAAGRLTGTVYPNGSTISYSYDAAGNLLTRTVNAVTAGPLAAAVLPASRSAQVGGTVTAFATIINAGDGNGLGCSIGVGSTIPSAFSFQTTDAANALIGTANTPVDIPAGAAQSFVISLSPSAPISPTDVPFNFDCTNTDSSAVFAGLNTLLLSASTTATADVIALVATTTNDGIVSIPGDAGSNAFAVATVNVGSGDVITASASTSAAVNLLICETDPATSACLQTASGSATTTIGPGATPTFGVFVFGTGNVPFDAVNNRVFVTFRDNSNVVRGSTSVAVRTE